MITRDAAEKQFETASPAFRQTRRIDELRAREFSRLDASGNVYLDFTGGALYAESQVKKHADLLRRQVLGNPHSKSPASACATALLEETRARVLHFFNAPADEYQVIFTSNATHALKLVGESYPFAPGGTFLLTFDNHNSVNGIREYARAHGARIVYVPVVPPEMRSAEARIASALAEHAGSEGGHLFAYPAQSNFRACSIRSSGSTRRMRTGGTFSSTLRRSRRRTCSTWRAGARTS
jgi:molybdenum cofactor sulfurtransferase